MSTDKEKAIDRLAYSPREVAEALGKRRETVYRWISAGFITAFKVRGSTFISADELARIQGTAGVSAGVRDRHKRDIQLKSAS